MEEPNGNPTRWLHNKIQKTIVGLLFLPMVSLKSLFFPSGLADVALRLGPEIGINMSNDLKTGVKHSGSIHTKLGQINTSPEQENGEKRQTTRKSPSQIRVSPRKATAKQQKKRGQGPTQNHKHTRFATGHEGVSDRVTETCRDGFFEVTILLLPQVDKNNYKDA